MREVGNDVVTLDIWIIIGQIRELLLYVIPVVFSIIHVLFLLAQCRQKSDCAVLTIRMQGNNPVSLVFVFLRHVHY